MTTAKKFKIEELKQEEFPLAFPLIKQLRTDLSLPQYIELAKEMQAAGYRVICLFEEGKIVAYAGFAKQVNLYYGSHIWVYDLVTDKERRGRGYGKYLLSHIEALAKAEGVNCIALSSGIKREKTHRFYENKMDYDIVSYVFKKNLME